MRRKCEYLIKKTCQGMAGTPKAARVWGDPLRTPGSSHYHHRYNHHHHSSHHHHYDHRRDDPGHPIVACKTGVITFIITTVICSIWVTIRGGLVTRYRTKKIKFLDFLCSSDCSSIFFRIFSLIPNNASLQEVV